MGPKHIPDDLHVMSENGRILDGILARHALTVANGAKGKFSGVITRERITKENTERSLIDLVCVSQDLLETLESIIIDEDKNYCLESIRKTKNAIKVT